MSGFARRYLITTDSDFNHRHCSRNWDRFTRDVLPDRYFSDQEDLRFRNLDIESLSASHTWAEIAELERWLSRQIFRRARPRIFHCDGHSISTDQQ
jgi:glyoxylase-like metal-dependent hydrolase (beta-lactamase superfamily II)